MSVVSLFGKASGEVGWRHEHLARGETADRAGSVALEARLYEAEAGSRRHHGATAGPAILRASLAEAVAGMAP